MTSRSSHALFAALGIAQRIVRPCAPTGQKAWKFWMATLKGERRYEAETAEVTPDEVEAMIDRSIDQYNNKRLHGRGEFVTTARPVRWSTPSILATRKEGCEGT